MSDRNTGLFAAGHVPVEAVADLLAKAPGGSAAALIGDEGPRVGHGEWQGQPFTHVALRLFEVGGLLLMDQASVPDSRELEVHLGTGLSRLATHAVYLFYDEERGAGGHARFQDGRLVSRVAFDGRGFSEVVRDLNGERPIEDLDPSDWLWPLIGEAVEDGARPVLGAGVRTDDDLEAVIRAAGSEAIEREPTPVIQPQASPQMRPQDPVSQRVVRGILRRLKGR
jgi:hypothetical protein